MLTNEISHGDNKDVLSEGEREGGGRETDRQLDRERQRKTETGRNTPKRWRSRNTYTPHPPPAPEEKKKPKKKEKSKKEKSLTPRIPIGLVTYVDKNTSSSALLGVEPTSPNEAATFGG